MTSDALISSPRNRRKEFLYNMSPLISYCVPKNRRNVTFEYSDKLQSIIKTRQGLKGSYRCLWATLWGGGIHEWNLRNYWWKCDATSEKSSHCGHLFQGTLMFLQSSVSVKADQPLCSAPGSGWAQHTAAGTWNKRWNQFPLRIMRSSFHNEFMAAFQVPVLAALMSQWKLKVDEFL